MRRLRPKDSAEGADASSFSSLLPFPLTIHPDGRDISAASFHRGPQTAECARWVEVTTHVLTEASISGNVDQCN